MRSVRGCASALRRCSAGPRLVGVRGVEAGQNLTGKEQCHAATGHDTFLVCHLGRVHRVVDAVLALLDLDLAAATDADDSDAARQLFTRAFTPYLATSPRQPPDRAPAPPSSGCHQTCRGLRAGPSAWPRSALARPLESGRGNETVQGIMDRGVHASKQRAGGPDNQTWPKPPPCSSQSQQQYAL